MRGQLFDLSLDEAVTLGLSGEPALLGYRSWLYHLNLKDKEGNFEATLHAKG